MTVASAVYTNVYTRSRSRGTLWGASDGLYGLTTSKRGKEANVTPTRISKRHPLQVNEHTYQAVREMAEETQTPMTRIVEQAVESYRNELLLRAHNEAWAELMISDPDAIAAYEAEDDLWDRSSADGLDV